jgi:hypothetical protein
MQSDPLTIFEADDEGCFIVMRGNDHVAVFNTYAEAHAFLTSEQEKQDEGQ